MLNGLIIGMMPGIIHFIDEKGKKLSVLYFGPGLRVCHSLSILYQFLFIFNIYISEIMGFIGVLEPFS